MTMLEPEYKYIDIVFENCNMVRVFPDDILFLSLDDIKENIWANMSGQLVRNLHCERCTIILKSSALDIKTHFEENHARDGVETFRKHLNVYKDITNVYIKTLDDKEIGVSVPYEQKVRYGPNELLLVLYNDNTFARVEHFKILIEGKNE